MGDLETLREIYINQLASASFADAAANEFVVEGEETQEDKPLDDTEIQDINKQSNNAPQSLAEVQKDAVDQSQNGAGEGQSYYLRTHRCSGTVSVKCPKDSTIRFVKQQICKIFYNRTVEEVILEKVAGTPLDNNSTLLDCKIFKNAIILLDFA